MPIRYLTHCWMAWCLVFTGLAAVEGAEAWPQFRGVNASGVAEGAGLPADIGPQKHLLWKTAVGKGHSSPVVADDRVYLTTYLDKQLLTLALDAKSGEILWKAQAPYEKLESIHRIGSYATPSVATDGKHVVSFFGSAGLFCYDTNGHPQWHVRMGPFDNEFGADSSPVLVGDRIVIVEDHDNGSFLAVFDVNDGKQVWRVERPNFRRNYSTPTIWEVDGQKQIVVSGTAQVVGYDLQTGKLLWSVSGISRVVNSTPVVGDDGKLYVSAAGGGGGTQYPVFEDRLKEADANKNGLLEKSELPKGPLQSFIGQFDRDKSGALDRQEYESIREILAISREVVLAIRPGGHGDITDTHVAWSLTSSVPRSPSPIYFAGHLYLVKDGGIVTSVDGKTGEVVLRDRITGTGKYFSSPVIGGRHLYLLDDRGTLTVIEARPDWKEVSSAEFSEDCYASPAVYGGRIFIRTVSHLYCLGATP